MAFDFPNTPTLGQIYQGYAWDGEKWTGGLTVGAGITREMITADRSYFVRKDGNDSNTGTVDSAGGAFLTIPKALDVVRRTLDLQGHNITISVQGGGSAYTEAISLDGPHVGGGSITIQGYTGTPLIQVAGANAIALQRAARITLNNLKIVTTGSGDCINLDTHAQALIAAIDFGAAAAYHITINNGAYLNAFGSYTISGNPGAAHIHMTDPAIFTTQPGVTITLSGTRAWGSYFIGMRGPSYANFTGVTFAGSGATGSRGVIHNGATMDAEGKDPDFFPGDLPMQVYQGGVFIANRAIIGVGGSKTFGVPSPGRLQVYDDLGNWADVVYSTSSGTPIVAIAAQSSSAGTVFVTADPGAGSNKWWVQLGGLFTNRYAGINSLRVAYLTPTVLQ